MVDVVLGHGYILAEDERERAVMKPYPPLGVLYLSAFLEEQGFAVEVLDPTLGDRASVEARLEHSPSVLGLYATFTTRPSVIRLLVHARACGWLVVVGGPDVAAHARRYLEHGAHVVVTGEGELTLAELAPWGEQARVVEGDIRRLGESRECDGPFDVVLLDLGVLNCVGDVAAVLAAVRDRLHAGGVVLACVMGPTVPWEWAWMVLHGRPAQALRRWRRGGVCWRGLKVHYPSITDLRRQTPPGLEERRVAGLGVVLPPTYAAGLVNRWPAIVGLLNRLERSAETLFPIPRIADHYLIELERV